MDVVFWHQLRQMTGPRRTGLTTRAEKDDGETTRPQSGEPSTAGDAGLSKRVRRALTRNPNIDGTRVAIEVTNRQVRLGGSVSSVAEKLLAEDEARAATGVGEVTNAISVAVPRPRSDVRIMGEILRVWSVCLGLDLSRVSAEVRNGIAFIRGTVASARLKSAAEELVLSIPFVGGVINDLAVSRRSFPERVPFERGAHLTSRRPS